MSDIKLNSVNFEHGMLLTPTHFLRQEQYFDSALLWLLRYATQGSGLVGGGPRVVESERGAVRHDPVVTIGEDDAHVTVSVSQCRGLSPSGCIVDIDPEHPVTRRFAKAELEGVAESGIYVVCAPHEKHGVDGAVDEFNPQMQTERRPQYRLSLQVPAQYLAHSMAVGRLRRARYGSGYEKDGQYIPPCATMAAYSELAAGWRKIVDETGLLAERYTELHHAMQEFLVLFKERGIDTDLDVETLGFVSRMVHALRACWYELLDPVQPPTRFFHHLRRFFHSAAMYLDLSPAVQGYFETLRDTGETEFVALLEGQRRTAKVAVRWQVQDDLGLETRGALQALADLRHLERALEGKYLDFRLNRTLEAMNFIFDRGGKVLYRMAAKPARAQGAGSDIIITFSQLRLEGREKYRLILVGEHNAAFEMGTRISAEIRINEGAGFRRAPVMLATEVSSIEQCNFEYDFDAPDVPLITDLRVSVPAHHPIRTALLYVRQRFYASAPLGERPPVAELRPQPGPEHLPPPPLPGPAEPPYRGRLSDAGQDAVPPPPAPGRTDGREDVLPPWEMPSRPERPGDYGQPPRPRRRRLE